MDYDKNFVGVTQKVFAVLESLSQQPKAGVSLDEITRLRWPAEDYSSSLALLDEQAGICGAGSVSNLYSLSGKFFELGTNALPYQRLMAIGEAAHAEIAADFR